MLDRHGDSILRAAVSSLLTGAQGQGGEGSRVIVSCDFEGPYASSGEQPIHDGCVNTWRWGRKDMLLKAGRTFVPLKPVAGIVQGLFEGDGRATWVVCDDAGVVGRKRLNLAKLPKDSEVLDVMGNDGAGAARASPHRAQRCSHL
jgi:hypothetical protein